MKSEGALNPIRWEEDHLVLIDQRKLPLTESYEKIPTLEQCHDAIKVMVVRGAPCIGFTAIFGMALFAKNESQIDDTKLKIAAAFLKSARPTAVNLAFEVDRCVDLILSDPKSAFDRLVSFGQEQMEKAYHENLSMAETGLKELTARYGDKKLRLMTHCNTGHLACGCLGTALGVISHSFKKGAVEKVWVDETRPYLQGTRLSSFELWKESIPHQVVVEGAASELMRQGLVDAVFVGADRIVKNGDTANKVGTATLAITAKNYGVPFYVIAPTSSFDMASSCGEEIEIEMRPEEEVLSIQGVRLAAEGVSAYNPSFDITKSEFITGIISEKGIAKGNYVEEIEKFFR